MGPSESANIPIDNAMLKECHSSLEKLESRVKSSFSSPEPRVEVVYTLAKNAVQSLDRALASNADSISDSLLRRCCVAIDRADNAVAAKAAGSNSKPSFGQRLCMSLSCVSGDADLAEEQRELERVIAEIERASARGGGSSMAHPMSSVGSEVLGKGLSKDMEPRQSTDQFSPASNAAASPFATSGIQPRESKSLQDDFMAAHSSLSGVLRKPSRQETVTGMCYQAPRDLQTVDWKSPSGRVWLYVSKVFGADKILIHNLASGIEQQADELKAEGAITAMYHDSRGIMWSGHRSGAVVAWKDDDNKMLCASARPLSSSITAITCDEWGQVWVGSSKGDVRRLSLVAAKEGAASIAAAASGGGAYEIEMHRRLRHTGSGASEKSASAEIDPASEMVRNPRAKEKAHEGPVTSIAAAVGRVWTSGGASAFVCLREWTQRGEFMRKHDLKSIGAAVSMVLVTPIVRVITTAENASSSFGSTFSAGSPGSSVLPRPFEVPQSWQLLTGHSNGVIQVWGESRGFLAPLLRIGGEASPITALTVHGPFGLICTSHLDGRLVVQGVPHPNGQSALSVQMVEGTVSAVKLPTGDIRVADSGVAAMDGGPCGVITAGYNASVAFWPATTLRSIAEKGGIAIQEPSSLPEQWPLRHLIPQNVQTALPAVSAAQVAASSNPAGGLHFSDGASQWQIDYDDLTMSRVIGEGAFGKVYLGRWHETDVAIKVLSSLSALGVPSAGDDANSLAAADAMRTLEREVSLMVNMRHPNVILFMGLCPQPPCIVTEFCSKGSLYDLLKNAREGVIPASDLDWTRRLGLALDSAKGMLYLHSHKPPIIHRDLKSPNLLVDGHWRAKVTDFNLSRLSEAPAIASSLAANNPRWQAPEIIHSRQFSASGDVYAFGLILWELATWELPFEQLSQYQIMLTVSEKGARPEIPSATSPALKGGPFSGYDEYVQLMKSCWAQNPADRPGFDHIIAVLRTIAIKVARSSAGGAGLASTSASEAESGSADATTNVSIGGGAVPPVPPVPSPFDAPAGGSTGGGPPPSPFDDSYTNDNKAPLAGAPPPMPSPFDGMGSPFDMAR